MGVVGLALGVAEASQGCATEHGAAVDALALEADVEGAAWSPPLMSCESKMMTTPMDVLVIYEASLLDDFSVAQVEGWIEDKIDQANAIFQNGSAGRVSYTLLQARPVSFQLPAAGPIRVLSLRDELILDPQHAIREMRDAYGADLVLYVTEPFADCLAYQGQCYDICGVATLPRRGPNDTIVHTSHPSRLFGQDAFALAEFQCGESFGRDDLTAAHELGHTLGMYHSANEATPNALYDFAYGYRFEPPPGEKGESFATLMDCVRRVDRPVADGVCSRIERLSGGDFTCSGDACCTDGDCDPSFSHTDNELVACSQATGYANFRTRSTNRPPVVLADGPSEAFAGVPFALSATSAIDPEDGSLLNSVVWIDEGGQAIGFGPSVMATLHNQGEQYVGARAVDSSGQADTYWIEIDVEQQPPAAVSPAVGPWSNPGRSGNGVDFQRVQGDQYVASWFTYRPDGTPIWYSTEVAPIIGTVWASPIRVHAWNGYSETSVVVGDISLDFSDAENAVFSWSLDAGGSGSEPYAFYVFGSGTGSSNGIWYAPTESGWGLTAWHQSDVVVLVVYLYDSWGNPTWVQGAASEGVNGWDFPSMYQIVDGQNLCPGCWGPTNPVIETDLGTAYFEPVVAGQAHFGIDVDFGSTVAGSWYRPSLTVYRLAPQ